MKALVGMLLKASLKTGLLSAQFLCDKYGCRDRNKYRQPAPKKQNNQRLFEYALSLSDQRKLDYRTCRRLMLQMKEENTYGK